MRTTTLLASVLGLATAIVGGPLPAQSPPVDGELVYTPLNPCRFYDSRESSKILAGALYIFRMRGSCEVPSRAVAVAVNLVAVGPEGPGHLTAWPSDQPKPATSVINYNPGVTIANGLILELASWGDLALEAGVSATHVVIDVVGYFTPQQRPRGARYGAGGIEQFPCVNNSENVVFGLSHMVADWFDAHLACPAGTWVCSPVERGSVACNTTRPDGTCDFVDHFGYCVDLAADGHRGWTRPPSSSLNASTVGGTTVDEMGAAVSARFGAQLPVWCCSPF